jgi:hypothetical protein
MDEWMMDGGMWTDGEGFARYERYFLQNFATTLPPIQEHLCYVVVHCSSRATPLCSSSRPSSYHGP